jgi:hypothetical protein
LYLRKNAADRNLLFGGVSRQGRGLIRSEVKGSLLGLFWLILNPVIMLAIYGFVFGGILGARFDAETPQSTRDYVVGLFLGLSIYQLLASVLATAPALIHQHTGYVKKMVFPLEVLPINRVSTATVRFSSSMVLLVVAMLLLGYQPWNGALVFLLCLAPILPMALGLSYLLSSLGGGLPGPPADLYFRRDYPPVFQRGVLLRGESKNRCSWNLDVAAVESSPSLGRPLSEKLAMGRSA